MKLDISPYTVVALLFSFCTAGLFYWTIPYDDLNLPNALITPALIVIALSAILLQSFTEISFAKNLNVMAAVIPAVVLSRVIIDGLSDPTSHNLWPIELVIAAAVSYAVVLPSVLIGLLFQKLRFKLPN